MRLFCIPHAGAGASVYSSWGAALAPWIEVISLQLPGREERSTEPAFSRLPNLLGELMPRLVPQLDRPFAFYGHSLGSIIGFELTRELRRQGLPLPLCFFAASRRAPQVGATQPMFHTLPDDELIDLLRRGGGAPESVLKHPRWRQQFLTLLRMDLEMSEDYTYTAEAPLSCPLYAFGGAQDQLLPLEYLKAWREQAGGDFELQLFPGGHIFHQQAVQAAPPQEPPVLRVISDRLLGLLGPGRGAREEVAS